MEDRRQRIIAMMPPWPFGRLIGLRFASLLLPCRYPSTLFQPCERTRLADPWDWDLSDGSSPIIHVMRREADMARSLGSGDMAALVAGRVQGLARPVQFGKWMAMATLSGYEVPIIMTVHKDGVFDLHAVEVLWSRDVLWPFKVAVHEACRIVVIGGGWQPSERVRPAKEYRDILMRGGDQAMAAAMADDLDRLDVSKRLVKGRSYPGELQQWIDFDHGDEASFRQAFRSLLTIMEREDPAGLSDEGLSVSFGELAWERPAMHGAFFKEPHHGIATALFDLFRPRGKQRCWDDMPEGHGGTFWLGRYESARTRWTKAEIKFPRLKETPTAHEAMEARAHLLDLLPGLRF